jgi:hypothetical protein
LIDFDVPLGLDLTVSHLFLTVGPMDAQHIMRIITTPRIYPADATLDFGREGDADNGHRAPVALPDVHQESRQYG